MPTYRYQPKSRHAALSFSLFSALSVLAVRSALYSDADIMVYDSLRIGTGVLRSFGILSALLCAWAAYVSLISLKNSFSSSRWIDLSNGVLSFPKHAHSTTTASIKASEIKNLQVYGIRNIQVLKIQHKRGVDLIYSPMLPDQESFQIMQKLIRKARKQAQRTIHATDATQTVFADI